MSHPRWCDGASTMPCLSPCNTGEGGGREGGGGGGGRTRTHAHAGQEVAANISQTSQTIFACCASSTSPSSPSSPQPSPSEPLGTSHTGGRRKRKGEKHAVFEPSCLPSFLPSFLPPFLPSFLPFPFPFCRIPLSGMKKKLSPIILFIRILSYNSVSPPPPPSWARRTGERRRMSEGQGMFMMIDGMEALQRNQP